MDNAGTYFDARPMKVTKGGTFFYMCSRNNNFSNRSQKGKIVVVPKSGKADELGSDDENFVNDKDPNKAGEGLRKDEGKIEDPKNPVNSYAMAFGEQVSQEIDKIKDDVDERKSYDPGAEKSFSVK